MEKLTASENENKVHAIFLDHRKLINNNIRCSLINEDGIKYRCELKRELFHYHPKLNLQKEPQTNPRKRKRLSSPAVLSISQKDSIDHYLNSLPKPDRDEVVATEPLPRYWEDTYSMPQMHGANASGWTQKFRSNTGKNRTSYLIPNDTRFYNHNVDQLAALLPQLLPSYDIIILDPPWRNKYIRRLKRAKEDLGYAMLDNDKLSELPLSQLINRRSLVAIWCTNAVQHQTDLEKKHLPRWNLSLLHKLRWYKLNTDYQLVTPLQEDITQKQPYEMLYLACHTNGIKDYAESGLKQTELLVSVPSIIHSHKPPVIPWLRQHIQLDNGQTEPECLELFARYLQPHCTSIGLEVLKLMDDRLYDMKSVDNSTISEDSNLNKT